MRGRHYRTGRVQLSPMLWQKQNINRMDTKRSAVWKYFLDLRKIDGSSFVECGICKKKYSHRGNTTNMFHHLKVNHPTVYDDILRQRQLENNPSGTMAITPNNSLDFLTLPQEVEVKVEPTSVDADQSDTTGSARADRTVRERSPSGPTKATIRQSANVYHTVEDLEEMIPQPSSSHPTMSDDCLSYSSKRCRLDEDLSAKVSVLSSEMREVKENVEKIARGGEQHFFNSISSEFDSIDDDSRDLIKAAIWQIIYRVKCARKKNVELSLNELLK